MFLCTTTSTAEPTTAVSSSTGMETVFPLLKKLSAETTSTIFDVTTQQSPDGSTQQHPETVEGSGADGTKFTDN